MSRASKIVFPLFALLALTAAISGMLFMAQAVSYY
jgi:hypothetical protein